MSDVVDSRKKDQVTLIQNGVKTAGKQSKIDLDQIFQFAQQMKNIPLMNITQDQDKASDTEPKNESFDHWSQELSHMMGLSQRLSSEIFQQTLQRSDPSHLDPLGMSNTWLDVYGAFMKKPETLVNYNLNLWQNYMNLCSHSFRKLNGEQVDPIKQPSKSDRRFKSKVWQDSIFDFIKQSYLLVSDTLIEAIDQACENMDKKEKERTLFFARQFIDAVAPTNFLMTNPEALHETYKTGGKNLIKGLENLVRDFERGKGRLMISQTDINAFKVGFNLATTPGKVVFRNELLELIHYTPVTKSTYAVPLLILPPFINKYYILDMTPENSMIKWLVEQGFSVFVASWKNPTSQYSTFSFDDYIERGLMHALKAIMKMTGQKQVSAVGYCIAGTMLSMALAKMKKKGLNWIKNATYFASQSDFSDAGELSLFVDEKRIKNFTELMKTSGGLLQGIQMSDTFNMLRSNDLIWSFVVNNYLLGKDPFPFDLLYWNSDTTCIPMQLQLDYLRDCYLHNNLAKGLFKLGNMTINLKDITIPMYIQSSKEDHIAPAASVYRGAKLYSGLIRFITAGSGHIAGVINHPSKNKYQYWVNDQLPTTFQEWFDGATEKPGSWWNDWKDWIVEQSDQQVKAFIPALEYVLEASPGRYVHE